MIALGGVRAAVLPDGGFAVDGGALFGVVPRLRWQQAHPPDADNRVDLALNVLLVESAGRRVLVDTGIGDRWGEDEARLYKVSRETTLLGSLAALGLAPEDVDVVVQTHLHFDHAGGSTRLVDGRPKPTFPRARYVVQKGEWEDATRPHERSRASYRPDDFVPLAEAGQLDLVEGEAEVAPGVEVVPTGGHTRHHQIVRVDAGEGLFVPTDLLPTASHLPLPWVMGFDLYPVDTLEAKRRLLAEAAERGSRILFYHDRRRPLGRVRRRNNHYVLEES